MLFLGGAEEENLTVATEFLLLGFSDLPELWLFLFLTFLLLYLAILAGNILLLSLLLADGALHSPMYFFLGNLSILDLCFTAVTVPNTLANLLTGNGAISATACAVQVYFLLAFGSAECYLLVAMAFDRFVAICSPLRYAAVMGRRTCVGLTVGSWFVGAPVFLGQTLWVFGLPFCGRREVGQTFCDVPPLLQLACTDTAGHELGTAVMAACFSALPFLLILGSYARVLGALLRMPSAVGRQKAFSTCSAHLLVVTLFYASCGAMYLRPKSTFSLRNDRLLALPYTFGTPLLNPLIYSLRNRDVKGALRRALGRLPSSERV
ncbi:olfactory receptor 10A4-like [Ornithorhynchus anatinus]|uniref:olfactory receptor 10A4-like n=1 Tax=Ornithorhynchus anatinus TaxID=9258 RepID=UPI0010A92CDE|nr:olfactory receptor 10A4-like [Ornithorhynchus anatinus]